FHLRMCQGNGEDHDPPLGWSLSKTTQSRINIYLNKDGGDTDCAESNHSHLKRLAELLDEKV
ncbi:MAG: hypothetical protein KZQ93_20610, partial [Candidatus Thiodiazotropha sp. (ex Monitilora ramsayi)]|nr:hypothetical protein [Candidatus Thiodiazotropha sp. (ex Monitilora ramsayi)]